MARFTTWQESHLGTHLDAEASGLGEMIEVPGDQRFGTCFDGNLQERSIGRIGQRTGERRGQHVYPLGL